MMHDLALGLKENGHNVTVVTPGGDHYTPVVKEDYEGINVLRFPSGLLKNASKPIRLINELLLSFRSWSYLKGNFNSEKQDLIIYYSPTIFWSGLVSKLKKKWNCPSYLILRDFFPQWVIDQGMLKESSLLIRFFKYWEKKNYSAASRIGVQSPKNLEWFRKYFPSYSNAEVLFNWVKIEEQKFFPSFYRTRLGLKGKVVFFYGGNIGLAQDMTNIISLAKRFSTNSSVAFVLVGSGDEFSLVQNSIKTENLTNLILLESVSQEEYRRMLAEFDIGLFTLHKDHKTHNFPGKILGYMEQGKPILGAVNSGNDLKDVLEEAGAGLVCESGDIDSFYHNANILLDASKREKMGKKSFSLLESKFSVDNVIRTILK